MYPLAWGLRRLFLLYAYLLSLVGGVFHRDFPLLSQSLAAAIRHTTSKDYSPLTFFVPHRSALPRSFAGDHVRLHGGGLRAQRGQGGLQAQRGPAGTRERAGGRAGGRGGGGRVSERERGAHLEGMSDIDGEGEGGKGGAHHFQRCGVSSPRRFTAF